MYEKMLILAVGQSKKCVWFVEYVWPVYTVGSVKNVIYKYSVCDLQGVDVLETL